MTKIKPVRVGRDWRSEIEFFLRFVALGFVFGLLFVAFGGRF